ncbi:MAG: selenium cofactor biosynthesis protein YqeC [Chloroflexi bacterium]|nr:selenium cofactor biosynthesis protein YqeC [Anaerolineaceae bacterium]MCY4105096.1 selenium cofactor biosynthesis protein YqeC [Chloroflexota bacterium]
MKLNTAFRVKRGDIVSFIGAGGKTATLHALGHELVEQGWRVLATTSTRIPTEQLDFFPSAIQANRSLMEINAALSGQGFVFLYDEIRELMASGYPLEKIPALLDSVASDVLLIEADDAAGRPLKAPLEHEPRIPPETTVVVAVASLTALGVPLSKEFVYNHEAIQSRYGFGEGAEILPVWLAQVLRDETLGLKGIPSQARTVVYLNRMNRYRYLRARRITHFLLRQKRIDRVAFGSARSADPVIECHQHTAAIVLAAGASTRMGRAKLLLPWRDGRCVLEQVVHVLHQTRIPEIRVVLGPHAELLQDKLAAYEIRTVMNQDYREGEMLSSLQLGLRSLPSHIQAALIVLGDQPRLQPSVVFKLLTNFMSNDKGIVAPVYHGTRGHPILIHRSHWSELLALTEGSPRDVIDQYPHDTSLVNVNSDTVLADVDTPRDYAQQRLLAGLPPMPIQD